MTFGLTSLIPGKRGKDRDDFFLRAFESGPQPRMITDGAGRAVHANAAFHRIFDCNARDPYDAMVAMLAQD
jgi:PAS domain-containing protein